MKIPTIITRAVSVGGLILTANLYANTARIYNTSNDGLVDARGGEFYAVTDANGSFYTFCVERAASIGFTETYTYDIGNRAFGANTDLHDPIGAGAAGDPISQGTAYLYEQFSKGILVDSDGAGFYGDQHDLNAGLLQKAFWTLEDEVDYGVNPYLSLVKSIFGDEGAFANYTGNAVQVMNLWGSNGQDIQSQLIYLPVNVPDTGVTIVLVAIGMVCIGAFRFSIAARSA